MTDDDILVALKKVQAIPVHKNSKWIVHDKEAFMKLGGTQKDWELYLKESGYTEAGIKKSKGLVIGRDDDIRQAIKEKMK